MNKIKLETIVLIVISAIQAYNMKIQSDAMVLQKHKVIEELYFGCVSYANEFEGEIKGKYQNECTDWYAETSTYELPWNLKTVPHYKK